VQVSPIQSFLFSTGSQDFMKSDNFNTRGIDDFFFIWERSCFPFELKPRILAY